MQFYVTRGGQQLGPFSPEQLRSQLLAGAFRSTDLAWHEGAPGWAPLNSYAEIVGPSSVVLPQSVPYSPPLHTSGLAIASMVLGILAVFSAGFTSVPAIICGHISLSQIKSAAGRISGNGFAIAGLITGYFSLLFLAAVLLGMALPIFAAVQERGQAIKCLSEGKQIGVACKLYAMDHQGNYPPTLNQLIPDYLTDAKLFECPLRKGQPPLGYQYFGGKDTDPADKVLLSSNATTRDRKRLLVFSNGSAALRRDN
jgi:hypothetical protein